MNNTAFIHATQPHRLITPVACWALLGFFFSLFSIAVFSTWVFSADFSPVPITAADMVSAQKIWILRGFEALSLFVAVLVLYIYLLRPLLKGQALPLKGLLLIGALLTYVLDTAINYSDFHMAWNKHAFNMGTWGGFFPGHEGPTRYAEAWFWGPPMYMYFGVALASIQAVAYKLARPLGFWTALACAFVAAFAFDFIAEVAIIRLTEAYAWPYTVASLTVWAGTQYQFPLYESLLVAIYASLYSWLNYSAQADGVSFIERGIEAVPARLRLALRFFAATGFAALCTASYFAGFYGFSQWADSRVEMPAYLQYSDDNWSPASAR